MFKKLYVLLAATCLIAVIINSCKKDAHTEQQNKISDPVIAQAKSWYESTYPAGNKLNTQTTTGNKDLSQLIKPDWQHTASYSRFNKQVIEMPIDPSVKFGSAMKNMQTGQTTNQAHSRSSYILLNKGSGYDAYVMTLIADSTYLKGDLSKLARNTYNKHEADFSGLVLYYTPNGKYVGGYRYKDGHLVVPEAQTVTPGTKVQSTGSSKLKPDDMVIPTEDCYDYYDLTYVDGRLVAVEYEYSACYSSGGHGGGGDGGYTPPSPCPPGTSRTQSTGGLAVNNMPLPPPDDGGFPPPAPTGPCTVVTPPPSTVPVPKILDSLGKKYPCTKALIAALPNLNTNIAQLIYQAFNSSSNNIIFLEGDPAHFTGTDSNEDGYTLTDNINNDLISRIYINPAVLANSTNEYRLVTLYHEALHAFLSSEHTTLGDAGFVAKYPMVNVFPRQNFSQVVNADKYDYYIDPAYQTKIVGKDHLTMADYFITGLKDAILAYNPSFPPDRALALAQTGIIQNKTELFNNYNDAERDVTKGTSVGHKCSP